jgi:N-methylhydantoinase A
VDLVHAAVARLDELDWEGLEVIYAAMRAEATALLGRLGAAPRDIAFEPLADLRYVGQGFEVVTPLPAGPYGPGSREGFTAAFEAAYRALYRRVVPGAEVEGLHWRLRASGPASGAEQVAAALRTRGAAGGAADGDSRRGERPAYFPELGGFVATPVHDRYRLWPGDRLRGPAIVEERESTVVLPPGTTARVDPSLTLVIDLEGGDGGA